MRNIVCLIVLMFSLGCASIQDTMAFDGSTEQTIQQDIGRVLNSLPRSKKLEFIMALMAIQF